MKAHEKMLRDEAARLAALAKSLEAQADAEARAYYGDIPVALARYKVVRLGCPFCGYDGTTDQVLVAAGTSLEVSTHVRLWSSPDDVLVRVTADRLNREGRVVGGTVTMGVHVCRGLLRVSDVPGQGPVAPTEPTR